jgi:Tfp pilus assembly protein PilF
MASYAADDRLARHRNLGKAFYENPTTQMQAVDEFRKALELAPDSARERLNYGLALLRAGKTAEGVAEIEKVQKQDPKIPHTWFNLGIQYKRQGEAEKAITQFEHMIKLVPDDPISHYNLGASYRLAGRPADALKHFEIAAKLDPNLAGPHFQLFNAYRTAGRAADAQRSLQVFQKIKKQQEGAVIPEDMEWNMYAEVYDIVEPAPAPPPAPKYSSRKLAGKVDPAAAGLALIDVDVDGKTDLLVWPGLALYRQGSTPVAAGLPAGSVIAAAPGDFDNDGWSDVVVIGAEGAALYRNVNGKFTRQEAALAQGSFNSAVWLDYDHDYDVDLFLLGKQSKLLRNQGTAGFVDRTADFPFANAEALDGVAFRLVPDTKGTDLVVSYRDRKGVLYRDKLNGVYEAEPFDAVAAGARGLRAVDANHDGTFEVAAEPRRVEADFDGDGDLDMVEVAADGTLDRKDKAGGGSWIGVRLAGVKNLKLARHAEVEVKAGGVYSKQIYEETPLTFAIGSYKEVDTVRITWPNGLIQNEPQQAAGKQYTYKEAQRLSGSCPMIWSWNGREFVFITDVLGVAPLGAKAGDGTYFPVDRDEYVQIPREAIVERDGVYEIRITEELSEVAYLDKVALVAVDHPAGVEIFTNDKFKGPPFPDFRLFGVTQRIGPVSARQNGASVLDAVLKRDRIYAERFRRDLNGVAETWSIELDFGERAARDGRAVLILNGWVDWADGSTFLAKAQEGRGGLITPYLQVKNAQGEWETVIEDMGMPAGKPKTIAVDLTGKFRSSARQVRIVTNLALYWDEIFLSENTSAPQARTTELAAEGDLRFRGFSRAVIHPERRQPETFLYPDPSPFSMWNQTPGMYTRYGPVGELLREGDDRFVIMGSGDELRLRFDARRLPAIKEGWTRDYLLLVEGWAKDRDANTAFSQTVEPLPFRQMSAYPYPAGEQYPEHTIYRTYRERYNVRPALRPLLPLRPQVRSR